MSTKIFVMAHKVFQTPADDIYVPLQVGHAINPDTGYLADDTGDNISDLNPFYSELTGFYWLWKNLDFPGNIGTCHYRRFFIDENGYLLKESDYDKILTEYDIITSNAIEEDLPYTEYFGQAHNISDLKLEGEVIKSLFPQYYEAFEECMNGKKHYFGNLLVTRKELFDEYCEWLFSVFAELGDKLDISGYDDYRKRIFGFLSEQLLMVWVKARKLKVYEGKVGIFAEKAENKELKAALSVLFREKKIEEAKALFYGVLKVRPDLILEHSDLNGDIPAIARLIDGIEKGITIDGKVILEYSTDLNTLMNIIKEKMG